jgi:diguanylate cyclase (GGDEF)-like protein
MRLVVRMILALGAVALIGGLDTAVSPRLLFSPFYAVPLALAAWHLGLRAGLVVAIAAGLARSATDAAWHGADGATAWNALAWTALLIALARLITWARTRNDTVTALDDRVSELIQIEHSYARTDPLTSLCNRRAFVDALQQAEARSRRTAGALAVARLDVDGFRHFNDTYSRADGDQLLRAIATSLALTTRMGDLAARLENDEFAVLLYGCGPEDAQRVGKRLVAEVKELGRAYPEARVTASIGIACFAAVGPDPDEMMRLAGFALHKAQDDGGDSVLVEREWSAGEPNTA